MQPSQRVVTATASEISSRVLASRWFVLSPALPKEAIPFMVSGDRPFSCTRRALTSFRVCFQSCMGYSTLGAVPCRCRGGVKLIKTYHPVGRYASVSYKWLDRAVDVEGVSWCGERALALMPYL